MKQPAFPTGTNYGMTLRDYFAAKAIAGLFHIYHDITPRDGIKMPRAMAEIAYELADAMMAAREAE